MTVQVRSSIVVQNSATRSGSSQAKVMWFSRSTTEWLRGYAT
jgi:hypothetical protein